MHPIRVAAVLVAAFGTEGGDFIDFVRGEHNADGAVFFSVADQRKALIAAIATSRTPVPSSMPASVANPSPRRYANTRALARRDSRADRRAVAKRGRTSASRRPLAKRGRAATNKRIARNTRKRRR